MTSSDGINWTLRTTPAVQYQCITWSKELGLFAALGWLSGVMTSPDGITWTSRTLPGEETLRGVAWSPTLGVFVTVGYQTSVTVIYTSTDGINWTGRTAPAEVINSKTVRWVPQFGAFVSLSVSTTSDKHMISFDGITWFVRTGAPQRWSDVVWSPELGILVAVSTEAVGTRNVMFSRPMGVWGTINTRLTRSQVLSRISLGV